MVRQAKDGVVGEGMVGFRFNTIGVSDGISMGTSGGCTDSAAFLARTFPLLARKLPLLARLLLKHEDTVRVVDFVDTIDVSHGISIN